MFQSSFAKTLLLLQLILPFTLSEAFYKYNKPIIGGKETSISEYPHQVSLRHTRNGEHFCSGAILSERWILSAAQCTQGSKSFPEKVYIVVGTANITSGGQRYNLDKIVNHPNFTWVKRQNDISLLRTEQPLRIENYAVFPIKFPSFKTDYVIENGIGLTEVTISGWGSFQQPQSGEETLKSNALRCQESRIYPRNNCRRYLGHVNGSLLSEDHLCTQNLYDEGMCIGDVGSPLITKTGELVGIASWRGSDCGSGQPDVYTRVFPHLNWIWNNLIDNNCV